MTMTMQLQHVMQITTGATPSSNMSKYWDGSIAWATPEDVGCLSKGYWLHDTRRKITADGYESCGATVVPANSLILTKRAPIGQLAILAIEACCNQGCYLLIPKQENDSRFLYYLLFTKVSYLQALGRGSTFMELALDDLKVIQLKLPILSRQRTIADYLDREIAKLDAMIVVKERLMELIVEKRRAMITYTVTKGLDHNVPVKSSGIDWLGNIPAHWNVIPLKRLGDIRYGLGEPPQYVDNGIPFIRATDIKRGKLDLNNVRRVDPSDIPSQRRPYLKIDDILVVRSGAYTGDSAIIPAEAEGYVAGYDMVLTILQAVPKFIAFALLSKYLLEGQIYLAKMRAAQPHLNAEELGALIIVLPPTSEQHLIVDHLERETAKLDTMLSALKKSLSFLNERRSALITEVVTGESNVEIAI